MSESKIDLDAAKLLAEDLSKKLAQAGGDGDKFRELREEVDSLRDILNGPNAQHFWITDRLRSMELIFERAAVELLADGIKAGSYLAEIGRILGVR
ncbi:MAG: hypothetical protein EXR28_07520 [Betaproteobacteria bacterium]|nr:hypothetical protein [Betaproteobacteria bacterium]